MKTLIAALLTVLCLACGDAGTDAGPDAGLGSVSMPLVTSTASHSYRFTPSATLQVWQAGVDLQHVALGGPETSLSIADLEPGNYDLFLVNVGSLIKDGAATVPATLMGANPRAVTVTAGAATPVVLSFEVEGDPVEFVCTAETCGSLNVSLGVTEVPPEN